MAAMRLKSTALGSESGVTVSLPRIGQKLWQPVEVLSGQGRTFAASVRTNHTGIFRLIAVAIYLNRGLYTNCHSCGATTKHENVSRTGILPVGNRAFHRNALSNKWYCFRAVGGTSGRSSLLLSTTSCGAGFPACGFFFENRRTGKSAPRTRPKRQRFTPTA